MFTNVNDYSSGEVFSGNGSFEELKGLQKALEALQITGRETTNLTTASGAALKLESLEKTLKVVTYSNDTIKFWQNIPKRAAYNTVEEFNQLSSYGAERGGFYKEGELPFEEDSTYVRRAQLVKYMGVTRSVTHPMSLVNTMVGNIVEKEIKNGTLWLLRKLSRSLTQGNANIIPDEFNGLYAQHLQNDAFSNLEAYYNSEVIVDMRGLALNEAAIENASEGIVENFGLGTHLFAPPKVLSLLAQNYYGNKFIPINTEAITAGVVGQKINEIATQYGPVSANWDVFLNPNSPKLSTDVATSPNAANAPTPDGVAPIAAVATDALSDWAAGDAGNYIYGVSAINRFGESALAILSGTPTTIAAGGAVDLKFAATASANAATGYRIYRSKKGATSAASTTFYPLFDISTSELATGYDGGAALIARDRNRILPNTGQAFLIQLDNETLEFAQLAPLMKMDLAITSPAYRFMILLYGTPLLYAPKRMVKFINCKLANAS